MEIFQDFSMYVWGWLIFAVVMLLVEGMTVALVSIWFAAGGFAAAVTAIATDSFIIQLLVCVVVTLIMIVFTRPLARKKLNSRTEKTNVEALVGQNAVITRPVTRLQYGEAKVNGMVWSAALDPDSPEIAAGQVAEVTGIEGVKLIVGLK